MVRVDVLVPTYGMTNNDSYVQAWLVEEGALVQEGSPLLMLETAKAETEVQAPVRGVVGQRLVAADTEVAPGTVLTWIETSDA